MNAPSHDFGNDPAASPGERLDLKAYELWTRCHEDGHVPSQQELLSHEDCNFVDHSVLIKLKRDDSTPSISHIGTQLWLGLDGLLPQNIDEVPARSVLSRITEHYLEAVANRTAVGFEAEFVNEDGSAIGYRAIALPCASDGERIDAVLGVVDYSMVEDETDLPDADSAPPVMKALEEPEDSPDQGAMPKEGWRSVIAKMRRAPDEPVADEVIDPPPERAVEPKTPARAKTRKRQALDPLPDAEPDSAPPPVTPSSQSAVIASALDQLLAIDGAIAAALVELDSGMPLASAGGSDEIDLDIAVAGNTEVLRAKYKALRALGLDPRVEDIMITLPAQYHLLRPLSASDGLFLCLVVDSDHATLGMARHELRRVERTLKL